MGKDRDTGGFFLFLFQIVVVLLLTESVLVGQITVQVELRDGTDVTGTLRTITDQGIYVLKVDEEEKRIPDEKIYVVKVVSGMEEAGEKADEASDNALFPPKLWIPGRELTIPEGNFLDVYPGKEALKRYRNGLEQEKNGNYKQAEKTFRKTIEKNKWFLPARLALGRVLIRREKYEKALSTFDRVLDTDNAVAPAWRMKSVCYRRMGKDYKYNQAVRKWIHHNFENGELAYRLAHYWLDRGDENRARQHWSEYRKFDPEFSADYAVEGIFLERIRQKVNRGHLEEALIISRKLLQKNKLILQQVMEVFGDPSRVVNEKVRTLIKNASYRKADRTLARLLQVSPPIYKELRDHVKSKRNEIVPEWASHLREETGRLIEEGRVVTALSRLRKALTHQPKLRDYLKDHLENVYRNQFKRAIRKQNLDLATTLMETMADDLSEETSKELIFSVIRNAKKNIFKKQNGWSTPILQLESIQKMVDKNAFPEGLNEGIRETLASAYRKIMKHYMREDKPLRVFEVITRARSIVSIRKEDTEVLVPLLLQASRMFLKNDRPEKALEAAEIAAFLAPDKSAPRKAIEKARYNHVLKYAKSDFPLRDRIKRLEEYLKLPRAARFESAVREQLAQLTETRDRLAREKTRDATKYFPLEEGATYTYSQGEDTQIRREIASVEEKEDRIVAEIKQTRGFTGQYLGRQNRFQVVLTENLMYIKEQVNQKYVQMKFPVRKGKSWAQQMDGVVHRRRVVSKKETVRTPSGMVFKDCLAIRMQSGFQMGQEEDLNPSSEITEYYAPGIGLVKVSFNDRSSQFEDIYLVDYHFPE